MPTIILGICRIDVVVAKKPN